MVLLRLLLQEPNYDRLEADLLPSLSSPQDLSGHMEVPEELAELAAIFDLLTGLELLVDLFNDQLGLKFVVLHKNDPGGQQVDEQVLVLLLELGVQEVLSAFKLQRVAHHDHSCDEEQMLNDLQNSVVL